MLKSGILLLFALSAATLTVGREFAFLSRLDTQVDVSRLQAEYEDGNEYLFGHFCLNGNYEGYFECFNSTFGYGNVVDCETTEEAMVVVDDCLKSACDTECEEVAHVVQEELDFIAAEFGCEFEPACSYGPTNTPTGNGDGEATNDTLLLVSLLLAVVAFTLVIVAIIFLLLVCYQSRAQQELDSKTNFKEAGDLIGGL